MMIPRQNLPPYLRLQRLHPRKPIATTARSYVLLMITILATTASPGSPETATGNLAARDKIDLMAGALRARSDGDLERARILLEALIANAPEDPGVQRLHEAVVAEIERQATTLAADASPAKPVPVDADTRSAPDPPAPRSAPTEPEAAGQTPQKPPDYLELFYAKQERISDLLDIGRAQLAAGDLDAAQETFNQVEAESPHNAEARAHQIEIAKRRMQEGIHDRERTKQELLTEVARAWQRPRVFDRTTAEPAAPEDHDLRDRLTRIAIPHVSFADVSLSHVIDTLSLLSEEYDPEGMGINMVLIAPDDSDPGVTITLRRLTLDRVLDFIVESVGFEYEAQSDVVVVRRGAGERTRLETDFFPITRSTIIRLTGAGAIGDSIAPPADPFAPEPAQPKQSIASSEEETAMKNFLQRAGVPFDTVPGANLALADGQIIVTQSARNMERVRNILRRYSEVKQVEIESRFLEVQQSELEELGFQWIVGAGGRPILDEDGLPITRPDGRPERYHRGRFQTDHRSLEDTFGAETHTGSLEITGPPGEVGPLGRVTMPISAPAIPRTLPLGTGAEDLGGIMGILGGADIELLFRALSRKQGSDLMSAPRITVLSGKTAQIVVAQEMRYPRNFTDMQAQVGRGDSGAGSAGVAITSGTPLDFTVRNVGVEMEVTPTVEDDNAISLLLEPQVTEFEGFVDYGGPSVAIASNRTVTVPSGFFQPIFSVRRIRTEVTIWDGATVVMGGLTREQAVSVQDKVPVLGDIPLLGRIFRSEGESSQKRNLLIFVTANLVSPGGSPMRQQFRTVEPGSLYQYPTMVTPGGAVPRSVSDED